MRKTQLALSICLAFLTLFVQRGQTQQLAFPGAEGFGKYATGGRTGSVYHVTNLNDAGTGSFRDAATGSNRIIVFDVAGVIKLTSGGIAVGANNYIAGQTAPGEGITVYGNRITFTGANNTICRYIRFRMGVIGTSGKDAVGIANGSTMIFDHISASWGRDETFSINWDSKGTEPTNITIQNSIIAQGLLLHSAGGLIQTSGGVSLYRNLYADNSTRNNKVKGKAEYVNNIVYNWNNAAYIMGGDSEGSSYVNVFGNYFIDGPNVGGTPISDGNSDYHIYGEDNRFDNNRDGILNGDTIPHSAYSGGPDFQKSPYEYPLKGMGIASVNLYNDLLPDVGASLPYRDYVDYYVVNEVKSLGLKGELLSTESTLPFGAPSSWSLWAGTTRVDTDADGMPDAYETANGLDPSLASDAMTIASNGYANIENYINSLTSSSSQSYLRVPLNLSVKSSTPYSITFKWLDYTRDETGFVIERYVNKAWVVIGTTQAEKDTFQLTGLTPEEKDTFRVKAVNSTMSSDYSNLLIAKSRPIPPPTPILIPDLTWTGASSTLGDHSSLNWVDNNGIAAAFSDSARVKLDTGTAATTTITLSETLGIKGLIVSSDNDYILQGTGSLSGKAWIYKTGNGNLSLLTSNTNTLQTVINAGTVTANSLANGGVASSIGQSSNSMYNLDLNGGKFVYSGSSVATDRNILLEQTSEIGVSNSSATLTMNGILTGSGGLIKSGDGTLKLYNEKGNDYEGETTISGGIINLDMQTKLAVTGVLGTSGVVNLAGGTLQTTNGQTANYEVYDFNINVPEGKIGGFIPYRNCSIKCKILGSGTLKYTIPYIREYVTGDWSEFTGTLNAYGSNSSDGSQLLLYNTDGMPNTRLYLTGNARIVNWATVGTMRLGGLSGVSGTYLSGSSKNTTSATQMWIVGGAGTDETFNGIINNNCSAIAYDGTVSIEKEGNGLWRLTGANPYKGTTTVSGGKLIVNGTNSATTAVSVAADATLAGTGTTAGVVTVASDGIIEPGDGSVGTLKLSGSLTMQSGSILSAEINKTAGTNDRVTVTGAVSLSGILKLTITGTLAVGNSYTIMSGSSFSGSFESIVPATPGPGMLWSFTNGVLSVVKSPATINISKKTTTLTTSEDGLNDEFSVNLSHAPSSNVVLLITSSNADEGTLGTSTLTFTPTNWNTLQTVSINGVDNDDIADGNVAYTVSVAVDAAASDAYYALATTQLINVVNNDNEKVGVNVTSSGSVTSELGAAQSLNISLSGKPLTAVVLSITSSLPGEGAVSSSSISFNSSNWAATQTVSITGVDDNIADGAVSYTITVAVNDASSYDAFDAVADQTISMVNTDNEIPGFAVSQTDGSTLTSESGTSDQISVVLTAIPTANVSFDVSSNNTLEATVVPAQLTFTPANWNVPQNVTLTGVDDISVDGAASYTIAVKINKGLSADLFDELADQYISGNNLDNDVAGLTITQTNGTTLVSESGSSDNISMVLKAAPLSNVTFNVASNKLSEATVSSSQIIFTPANWNVSQTITITGIDDQTVDGSVPFDISVSVDAANSDKAFGAIQTQTISGFNADNDVAGFTLTQTDGSTSVSETGTTDNLSVVLNAAPLSNVTFQITSSNIDEASVSPSQLVFTSQNWNIPQNVTVMGIDDLKVDGDASFNVAVSIETSSSDDAFDAIQSQSISGINADNDVAGFSVSQTNGSTSVSELGTTDLISVVLSAAPTSNVTFNVVSNKTNEVSVNPSQLVFTADNWNVAQNVTLTGVDDQIVDGSVAFSIKVSVDAANSNDAFSVLPFQSVSGTNADNDVAGFTLTQTDGSTSVSESGSYDNISVVLNAAPLSNVTINLESDNTNEATVSPSRITFTPENWNVAQWVVVAGVDDQFVDGTISFTIKANVDATVSDNTFDSLSEQLITATNEDDEQASFSIVQTNGSTYTNESGTKDYFFVVLNAAPMSNVSFAITSGNTAEGTISPSSLVFTSTNWNIPQKVYVTGVTDSVVDGNVSYKIKVAIDSVKSYAAFSHLAAQYVTAVNVDNVLSDSTKTFTVELVQNVIVSPNPTTDYIYVDMGKTTSTVSIAILNLSGRTIRTQNATNSNTVKLFLGDLPKGVYLLNIRSNEAETIVRKIVKE